MTIKKSILDKLDEIRTDAIWHRATHEDIDNYKEEKDILSLYFEAKSMSYSLRRIEDAIYYLREDIKND